MDKEKEREFDACDRWGVCPRMEAHTENSILVHENVDRDRYVCLSSRDVQNKIKYGRLFHCRKFPKAYCVDGVCRFIVYTCDCLTFLVIIEL